MAPSPLDLAELAEMLRATDPAALLVPPRLLRRVIKRDRRLTGIGLQVPHRKSYVIGRDALLELVDRSELSHGDDWHLPATLLLIAQPDPAELASLDRNTALVKYWRLLFHCAVHRTIADRQLSPAAIRKRIYHIGRAEFDEVRTVLRQERFLLPPRDDRTVYEEFAALYLELKFFAPTLVTRYFPGIDAVGVEAILVRDVDGETLLYKTRLNGASARLESSNVATEPPVRLPPITKLQYQAAMRRADRASAKGNAVRAAIVRTRAAQVAVPKLAHVASAESHAELDQLVERLRLALQLSKSEAKAWRAALPALLPYAARGLWPAEARLLYDLQKICAENERPIFAPDLVEWIYSRFRRPLVRPLPDRPLVLAVKHLRSAANRLPRLRVDPSARSALSQLLSKALHHAEAILHRQLRPILETSLASVGLNPGNLPERVARDKLVEELLDQIAERGYFRLGDLRDVLSRNQLKLPDLGGAAEFFHGDSLIRVNRILADRLPGIYRRGEVYFRALQRGSSLAFGTRPGRWLTRFVALPFGMAIATVVFVQELLKLAHLPHELSESALGGVIAVLGVFYLGLIHHLPFRSLVVRGLKLVGRLIRGVFFDLPLATWRMPLVRWIVQSRPWLLVWHYVIKPLPAAIVGYAAMRWFDVEQPTSIWASGAILVVTSLVLNSRPGRELEEAVADFVLRRWAFVRGLVPGLIRLIVDLFKWLVELLDRGLYAVDEWFRFRQGQSRLILVTKIVLGLVWSAIAYVIRLTVSVFVEPTFNPIKHFPVVTVAAKLLLAQEVVLTKFLIKQLRFLGKPLAYTIGGIAPHGLPGAAGFLVWEFKENWKLYRTNRSPTLRPVIVGHHGETIVRLLRPGFHSGTLPKLFFRLRRAERNSINTGDSQSARKLRAALEHVTESIRHFAEREFVALINGCRAWSANPIQLSKCEVGSNQIRLIFACASLSAASISITFEEQSGWLLARADRADWLSSVNAEQAAYLGLALRGFYQLAGVNIVGEQLEACLPQPCPPYDITDAGLVVWPGPGFEVEVIYDFTESPLLHPRLADGQIVNTMPVLDANAVFLVGQAMSWNDWVAEWEQCADRGA